MSKIIVYLAKLVSFNPFEGLEVLRKTVNTCLLLRAILLHYHLFNAEFYFRNTVRCCCVAKTETTAVSDLFPHNRKT